MVNPMDLTGKHILITGGSSGIGRESAIQASKLGATVTIVARNGHKLRETIGLMNDCAKHRSYEFDLSETEQIKELIYEIVEERGPIDGFCHSAGIAPVRPLKMSKPKFAEKLFRIHNYAFIEIVRLLSLDNNLNDGASLVGISSIAAHQGGSGQGIYSSVKAGMEGFVSPASAELSRRGIRINTISYAMVDTDMYKDFLDYGDQALTARQTLGIINPQKAANIVNFILSDACPYITASNIPVWAGY